MWSRLTSDSAILLSPKGFALSLPISFSSPAQSQEQGWGPAEATGTVKRVRRPAASFPRCFLLSEIEKEEKEKLWYYSQLQGLSKRLDELPHVDTVSSVGAPSEGAGRGGTGEPGQACLTTAHSFSQQFSMQMDLIRQQLEFEAQHIRSLMEERFGTSDEMVQRAQVRGCTRGHLGVEGVLKERSQQSGRRIRRWSQRWEVPRRGGGGVSQASSLPPPCLFQIRASRLEQIDKELLEAQDRVQQTEPQVPGQAELVPKGWCCQLSDISLSCTQEGVCSLCAAG